MKISTVIFVLFLCNTVLFAQEKTLNSILEKSDSRYGLVKLRQELELYSKSKPTNIELSIPEISKPIPIIFFEKVGVGISDKPFSCRECIGTIAVFPNRLKEDVPYLGVTPNATVGSLLKGLEKLNDVNNATISISFFEDSKTLYIHTSNYYFVVKNVESFSSNSLKITVSSRTNQRYYYFDNIADLKSHIPDLEKLKVYVISTDFPPPAVDELK